jgi:hypothetical protein
MHRDILDHLLLADLPQTSRAEFLRIALDRLGRGCHFYSRVEDGKLVHWGWLAERPHPSVLGEAAVAIEIAPACPWLFDFHTHPQYRNRGFLASSVMQMLVDAASIPGTEKVAICYREFDRLFQRLFAALPAHLKHQHLNVHRMRAPALSEESESEG